MHARQYPIIAEIADIDMYAMFRGIPSVPMQEFDLPQAAVFSCKNLYTDISQGLRPAPFAYTSKSEEEDKEESGSEDECMLTELKNLFGDDA